MHVYYWCVIINILLMHRKEEGGKNLETADWQLYADSIFPLIETYAEGGALLWNWDCQFAGWSMKGLAEEIGVTWNL